MDGGSDAARITDSVFGGIGKIIEAAKDDHHPPRPPRPRPPRPDYDYEWERPTYYYQTQTPTYVQTTPTYVQTTQPAAQTDPLPNEAPAAEKVVEKPIEVADNAAPRTLMKAANASLIHGMQDQIERKTDEQIEAIQDVMDDKEPPLAQSAANLDATKYADDKKAEILKDARDGNLDGVIMATNGDNSPEAKALRDYAQAQQTLNEVRDSVVDGTLTDSQRAELAQALNDGGFGTPADFQPYFDQLDQNNALAEVVNTANPGMGGGPVDSMVLLGGMGTGQVIDLGSGCVLVGTGGLTSGAILTCGNEADALGLVTGCGDPIEPYEGDAVASGSIVINRGPSEVNFVVAGNRYSLAPGYLLEFAASESDAIEFYGQGSTSKKRYALEDGTYEFKYAGGEWELYQKTYTATIDNGDNPMPFQYVVNNELHSLAPGGKQEHSSQYPLVLRFDNGYGEVLQKQLSDGDYHVAVTADGSLEVFEASAVASPAPIAELARAPRAADVSGNWSGKSTRRRASTSSRRRETASNSAAPQLFN